MGVLADLVAQSQPAYFGEGSTASATAGATWLWPFEDVVDNNGDAINLTTVTGTCQVVTTADSVLVTTLTFTGAAGGSFTLGKDEADTAALTPGKYRWRFTLNDGTDTVQVWGGDASKFNIEKA